MGFERAMVPMGPDVEKVRGLQIVTADSIREALDLAPWE